MLRTMASKLAFLLTPDYTHTMTPALQPGRLEIRVEKNYDGLSRLGANLVLAELKRKPDLILCASAGGSPTGMYARLAARCARDPALFRKLRILQVDEWYGLPAGHEASCESDLRRKLIEPLRIPPARFIRLNTTAPDPAAECARVNRWLSAYGPIDICILGLGTNGHIAMNEHSAQAVPTAHVARLAPSSRRHALLQDLPRKPRFGMTLGLGDILGSRKILLLVSGTAKQPVLARLTECRVNTQFPASFLWLHSQATVLCDRASFPPCKTKIESTSNPLKPCHGAHS